MGRGSTEVQKTRKKDLNQYLAILTEQAWSATPVYMIIRAVVLPNYKRPSHYKNRAVNTGTSFEVHH